MANYKFTNKAVDDITRIWNYTFDTWSELQADNYYQTLLESCKRLATYPELGKNYADIIPDLKGFKVGRHVIFYRKIEEGFIEITRILHEQMDLKNRVLEK